MNAQELTGAQAEQEAQILEVLAREGTYLMPSTIAAQARVSESETQTILESLIARGIVKASKFLAHPGTGYALIGGLRQDINEPPIGGE